MLLSIRCCVVAHSSLPLQLAQYVMSSLESNPGLLRLRISELKNIALGWIGLTIDDYCF